ncbi:unnamed protein product [Dicrocoelium dendriticum]|nr:unnamed protein product [Dicrocoelium dendriticum]
MVLSDSFLTGGLPEIDRRVDLSTNLTLLLDEDPALLDGSGLFDQFHETWRGAWTSPLELPLRYCYLCTTAARALPKLSVHALCREGLPDFKNLVELLNLEKDTWSLVSALYIDRLDSATEGPSADERITLLGNKQAHSDYTAVRHSEREIVKLLYERDSKLRETQMLIDWLERRVREHIEEVAEKYECLFNESSTWENTAHALSYLPPSGLKAKNLPPHLHPDATSCTGTQLDSEDQARNDRYLHYLFLCIRGGDMQRAQRLCMQRGEFWRAVSFEGWRPFHYSGFVVSSQSDRSFDQMDTHSMDVADRSESTLITKINRNRATGVTDEIMGNTNRILFKSVCWCNAENTSLSSHERAIYAALSGNLHVLTSLLPASWTDITWAHCRAMVEARVDSSLRGLLHTGPRANTLAVTGKTLPCWPPDGALCLPESAWGPKDWSVSDLFSRVESCLGWSALSCLQSTASAVSLGVVRGSSMNDFLLADSSQCPTNFRYGEKGVGGEPSLSVLLYCIFYATHQALMLREYDDYLLAVAGVMPRLVMAALGHCNVNEVDILQPPSVIRSSGIQNTTVSQVLRFAAHLVLFLRSVEPCIPDEPCAQILKAYLSVLMIERRAEAMASYAAALPSTASQVDWYSSFLADIVEPNERERCLALAVSSGFNVQQLTRAVVRLLRERQLLLSFPTPTSPASVVSGSVARTTGPQRTAKAKAHLASLLQDDQHSNLSEIDRMRINSLDWLFYDPRQRGEALVVANSLLRTFIAMNCLKAAEQIISKLPPGTLGRAKIICENSASPNWLVNTIREHECLVLYLESQDAFADWFRQANSNRPQPPADLTSSATSMYGSRGFTERLQADESKRMYEARLERWRHVLRLDTETAAEKLLALLTYPAPGWLVDIEDTGRKNVHPLDSEEIIDDLIEDYREHRRIDGDGGDVIQPESQWASPPALSELGDSASSRHMQMQVLRENCLTDAVFLLVKLYQNAEMHEHCVRLADLVASKEHGIFKLFSKVQLRQFFDRLNESIEHLVASFGDPLGYLTEGSDPTLEQLAAQGWVISQKGFEECLKKMEAESTDNIASHLLDTDLRELGGNWIANHRQQDQLDAGGRIVQIIRVRNIALPQIEEDSSSATAAGGPRLLRLALTDGTTTVSALDIENHDKLSTITTPGTKLRLSGLIPISLGFLLLRKAQVQVLGGSVANLLKEWTVNKMFGSSGSRYSSGAPPFVPFGSREAFDLIQLERKFLQSIRDRNRTENAFDSFKLATSSNTADKENEFDESFNERRKDVIARVKSDQTNYSAKFRFHAGGSKFADLRAEKMQAYDESLAQLISLGFAAPLANSALKINKGDYKASLDYLLAKQVSSSKLTEQRVDSATSRGRARGKQTRRRAIIDLPEDDPRFDPAAAAAAAGLPARPSTGLMRLDDLMSGSSSRSSKAPGANALVRLPIGCPILAPNMFGSYEEAQLIGSVTRSVGTSSADKVALVVYTRKSADGSTHMDEELVPIDLIRTLNNEKITFDMLPVAPGGTSATHSVVNMTHQENSHSDFTNGYPRSYQQTRSQRTESGYRPRGRSFTRMRRGPR